MVGANGKVIGVDMNDCMLDLVRRSQIEVSQKLGYDNVTFHKGKIQDMTIDRNRLDAYLSKHPVRDERCLRELESEVARMRRSHR